jgi:uncharacterized protein DUF6931
MSHVRFATARALFETFPQTVTKLSVGPTDDAPVTFLRNLSASGKTEDAVTFCAYLLPRREAVWWACGCVKSFLGDVAAGRPASLDAAEAWVRVPNEEHRLAALEVGTAGDNNDPLTWLALAAGWAGGLLASHPKMPAVPVPQYLTARAARIAVLLSAQHVKSPERASRIQARIAEGIKLAEAGL